MFACGDDEGGDEANDGADDRPGEDDFAPDEESATESTSDSDGTTGGSTAGTTAGTTVGTTADSSADGSSSGGASDCVEAGAACEPTDLCSTWSCTCVSGFEFMTVGSCDAGTCTTNGTVVCDPVCMNNGGTMTAVDDGCA